MDPRTCPTCGGPVAADDPQGLCPSCLVKGVLAPWTASRPPRRACPSCQASLGEDARFCAQCGAGVPQAMPAEGDPLRAALEAKLLGHYRLVRLLGRGGMGSVYLARDLTLDREVAIKVVKPTGDAAEMYDRLRREARTAARLSHPNIVPLHAFGEVEGMPYFVMGYVRGESLATRLRRDGRLSEDEARRVIAEVADALDHAHRQGVVHRDIKPDNVLLDDETGRALLTDFGVARALGHGDTMTGTGSVVGTPHYMSPEQAAGRADIDGRTDIYSLGVMAYAMLTGRLPFDGGTAADVLAKHLTQQPPSLRSLVATVSDATVQAVERCLAKEPAQRWPDGRSLKLALGTMDDGHLPDALHAAESKGVFAAFITWIYVSFLAISNTPTPVKFLIAGVIASLWGIAVWRLTREGFTARTALRTLFTEPPWWVWWYPRDLRRRGNVWDRLPAPVRRLRAWLLTFMAYTAVLMALFLMLVFFKYWRWMAPMFHFRLFVVTTGALLPMAAWWAVLKARARRELERQGLDGPDLDRVLTSVPASRVSFWNRPHIAALLAPEVRAAAGRPESPNDELQAILRHADALKGPLRALGAQAAVAGRQLLAAIEAADKEVADLARSVEPGEEERLAGKIKALEGSATRADGSASVRQFLEKQLELVRAMGTRIEEAKEERGRRVEMLRMLSLHVASLQARHAAPTTEVRSLSDRVKALCDDIARQSAAMHGPGTTGGTAIDRMATLDRPRER